jgi:hypothetical protein
VTKKQKHDAENEGLECVHLEYFHHKKWGTILVDGPAVKTDAEISCHNWKLRASLRVPKGVFTIPIKVH